jgi:AraC-like DNA-binding protein
LRPEGNDQIDLYFDCASSTTGLKRTEIANSAHFRVESLSGSVMKVATGFISVPSGMNALCLNSKGSLIARITGQNRLVLVPNRSLTFIRGSRLVIQAARGEHEVLVVSWPNMVAPLLEHWISLRANASRAAGIPARNVACKPLDPFYNDAATRLTTAIQDAGEAMEPLVVSALYEIVARLMTGVDEVQLAAAPLTIPDTIKELIIKVRKNPAGAWPLKDAADLAGYSPFHFSRVFKGLVGYGFHEYVDRCRTECAVEMLCTTDAAVDMVASTCGFGTTQGLRESVKEYLGLVPSELRAVPENFDRSR